MSVIAIRGVPLKWNLKFTIQSLAKAVDGPFEALNFEIFKTHKTCYIRLSEKLDPMQVIQRINEKTFKTQSRHLRACIPDKIPDLPLAKKPLGFQHKNQKKISKYSKDPQLILRTAHREILLEINLKYSGLHDLNRKTGNKLMEEISQIVHKRLERVLEMEDVYGAFPLTMNYRKSHPHSGDFQLLLSTLHSIEDSAGSPRTQLSEEDLLKTTTHTTHVVENVPQENVHAAQQKYSSKMIKRIIDHVKNLDTEVSATDTEEESAKKRVREELKKLQPYMDQIVRQVMAKHFVPEKISRSRIRIYGEPFLPGREHMSELVKRARAFGVKRSQRTYNLLLLTVPPQAAPPLLAMDSTQINGAKLIIRSVDAVNLCNISGELSDEEENKEEDAEMT